MEVPVLFIIFNRPDTTLKVFERIRSVRPAKLFVVADGPRKNNSLDVKKCLEARSIFDKIDWPCELKTLYREENLGCKHSVSTGIDWFFDQVESGIILEDDCLPDSSFFSFCEVILDRYRDDSRIGHICGSNFQSGVKRMDGDYYFSNLTHVWGWASWRRVWRTYDVNMKLWPEFKNEAFLRTIFPSKKISKHLDIAFEKTYRGQLNTWDYQLFFNNLSQGYLSIIPNRNLISNIGFSSEATHTVKGHPFANLPTDELFNFRAPKLFRACVEADLITLKIESNYIEIAKSIMSNIYRRLLKI